MENPCEILHRCGWFSCGRSMLTANLFEFYFSAQLLLIYKLTVVWSSLLNIPAPADAKLTPVTAAASLAFFLSKSERYGGGSGKPNFSANQQKNMLKLIPECILLRSEVYFLKHRSKFRIVYVRKNM